MSNTSRHNAHKITDLGILLSKIKDTIFKIASKYNLPFPTETEFRYDSTRTLYELKFYLTTRWDKTHSIYYQWVMQYTQARITVNYGLITSCNNIEGWREDLKYLATKANERSNITKAQFRVNLKKPTKIMLIKTLNIANIKELEMMIFPMAEEIIELHKVILEQIKENTKFRTNLELCLYGGSRIYEGIHQWTIPQNEETHIRIELNNSLKGNSSNSKQKIVRIVSSIPIQQYLVYNGYIYPEANALSFYCSIKTKGFVILSGLTGTGKTKMAQELAELLDPSGENFLFLPVHPDWRDSKPLLGYYNPLDSRYYKTRLLEFILRAIEDYKQNREKAMPYFLLLDEMNLAHVEYYFADFLSVLESGRDDGGFTREGIKLHDVDEIETFDGIPKELHLPPNLYIIGTVNMDETTYSFSPKVLDRAFTIEFHDVGLDGYPPEKTELPPEELEKLRNDILNDLRRGGKFLTVYKKGENNQEKGDIEKALEELKNANNGKYWEILKQLNSALKPYDLHFGYRVVDEIALFLQNAKESREKGIVEFKDEDEIFDLALLMKVLPKFHGNRRKLEKPLLIALKMAKEGKLNGNEAKKKAEELWNELFGERTSSNRVETIVRERENTEDYTYKHTARKTLRMLRQLYEIGFASFS